ncbi:MAG: WYL domain-containing protein [Planctomycetes bacterium]|nr:WYL domain-containing protein [Planctomycetota bacterium]
MRISLGTTERQLNLLSALLKSGVPISWPDVARIDGYNDVEGNLRSRQKRFERDLKALENAGLKVERTHDGLRPYYQLNRAACLLPPIDLTPDHRVLMYRIGLAYLDGDAAGPLGRHLSGALLKLQAGAGGAALPAKLPRTFVRRTLHRRPGEGTRLTAIGDALIARHRVRFKYQGRGGEPGLRVVAPYALVSRRGGWYLVGNDETRGAVRTFRLSRIRGAVTAVSRGTTPEYEIPEGFDPENSFSADIFSSGKDACRDVRILFDAEVAFIVENEFAGVYSADRHKDGSVTLHLPHAYPGELFSYLGEFPGHWEVLGPPALRRLVVQRLKESLTALEGRRK